MKTLIAKYGGSCDGCGGFVTKGSRIQWNPQNKRTYHPGCAPSNDAKADREYWKGAAEASRYLAEKEIYGEALVDQWEMEREMQGRDW